MFVDNLAKVMKLTFKGEHKILTDFHFGSDASLIILTGHNGSGKSQFLNFLFQEINFKIIAEKSPSFVPRREFHNVEFSINSQPKGALIWHGNNSGISVDNQEFTTDLFINIIFKIQYWICPETMEEKIKSKVRNNRNIFTNEGFAGIGPVHFLPHLENQEEKQLVLEHYEKVTGKPKSKLNNEDIIKYFPIEIIFRGTDLASSLNLSFIFYLHIYKRYVLEIDETSPWDLINDIFRELDLPMEIVIENISDLVNSHKNLMNALNPQSLVASLFDKTLNKAIKSSDLSSGERLVTSLGILLYSIRSLKLTHNYIFLDEPDAHLHPSMIRLLFKVVYDYFIKKNDVKVVMTTHSPTTIAIAPQNEIVDIFQLSSRPFQIKKVNDSDILLRELSEGIITVNPLNRFVIVEGVNDKPFYDRIYKHLFLKQLVNPISTLVFLPGKNAQSVNEFTKNFRSAGFDQLVFGIIDRDINNTPEIGVSVLNRYSIENYLLDPFLLIISIPKARQESGWNDVINLTDQMILDTSIAKIQSKCMQFLDWFAKENNFDNSNLLDVEYINGLKLKVPDWVLNARGKTLQELYQRQLRAPSLVTNQKLIDTMIKLSHIPVDLKDIFNQFGN